MHYLPTQFLGKKYEGVLVSFVDNNSTGTTHYIAICINHRGIRGYGSTAISATQNLRSHISICIRDDIKAGCKIQFDPRVIPAYIQLNELSMRTYIEDLKNEGMHDVCIQGITLAPF